jgi:hypothetical protein
MTPYRLGEHAVSEIWTNISSELWGNIRSCTLQEILSKTNDPDAPLQGEEFYDLRLFEERNELGTRHVVLQGHTVWSDRNHDINWESVSVRNSPLDWIRMSRQVSTCF